MELDKFILSDSQIKHLPLFFKIIYHNTLIDPVYESKLMFFNSDTKLNEMRTMAPLRRFGMLYDYERVTKKYRKHEK